MTRQPSLKQQKSAANRDPRPALTRQNGKPKYRAKSLKSLERVKGIEPSYSAWKAAALPLSYTRAWEDRLTRRGSRLNLLCTLR
jgi:hypothetical protein